MYCKTNFITFLEIKDIPFKQVKAPVDHELLHRGLEVPDENGRYQLLVADSPDIAMRGLDYRAPRRGLLLLVQQPFAHRRQA